MNLIPVESSNIKAIGYDESLNKLFIQYKSEKIYFYNDVSKEVYTSFLNSESKGKFYYSQIKGKYVEGLVTEEK